MRSRNACFATSYYKKDLDPVVFAPRNINALFFAESRNFKLFDRQPEPGKQIDEFGNGSTRSTFESLLLVVAELLLVS